MDDPTAPRKGSSKHPDGKHGEGLTDIFRAIDEEEVNEELAPRRPDVPQRPTEQS